MRKRNYEMTREQFYKLQAAYEAKGFLAAAEALPDFWYEVDYNLAMKNLEKSTLIELI